MILSAATLSAANLNFRMEFQTAFDQAAHADHYLRLSMVVPSTTSSNVYPWLRDTFQIREWLGERVYQNIGTADFSLKNKEFEGTVRVKRPAIEDDQLGVYKPMFQQMGHGTAIFPNRQVFGLFKQGFTSLCWDGQYFFDTDHVGYDEAGEEISVSNFMGGTGTAWYLVCSTHPTKPIIYQERQKFRFVAKDNPNDESVFSRNEFVYGVDGRMNVGFGMPQLVVASKQDLTHDNYAAARAAFAAFRTPTGEPMGLIPDLLVAPQTLEGAARKVLVSETKANGESNEWKGSATLFSTPWL